MFQLFVLLVVAVVFASVLVFFLVMLLSMAVMALAIGVPAYLAYRYWFNGRSLSSLRQKPLERLQNLYVEGKIDLFEYERRVRHLIALEH